MTTEDPVSGVHGGRCRRRHREERSAEDPVSPAMTEGDPVLPVMTEEDPVSPVMTEEDPVSENERNRKSNVVFLFRRIAQQPAMTQEDQVYPAMTQEDQVYPAMTHKDEVYTEDAAEGSTEKSVYPATAWR